MRRPRLRRRPSAFEVIRGERFVRRVLWGQYDEIAAQNQLAGAALGALLEALESIDPVPGNAAERQSRREAVRS